MSPDTQISQEATNATSRYQSILSVAKERVRAAETLHNQHQRYDIAMATYREWLDGVKEKVERIRDPDYKVEMEEALIQVKVSRRFMVSQKINR